MADYRMIGKRIINTAKFLRLPGTARELYLHLIIWADDAGVTEAFPVLKLIDASEDDLKILSEKKFIKVLDEDELIVHIVEWEEHNKIPPSKMKESRYFHLLETAYTAEGTSCNLEGNSCNLEGNSCNLEGTSCNLEGNSCNLEGNSCNLEGNSCNLEGNSCNLEEKSCLREEKIREDKIREDKGSKEKRREEKRREENVSPNSPTPSDSSSAKKQYAEFVSLTEEEYNKLVAQHGEEATLECVEILDNYKGASGKKYKSDYRAILTWVLDKYRERHRAKPLEARASPARNDAQATLEEMKRRIEARYQNDGQADTDPF